MNDLPPNQNNKMNDENVDFLLWRMELVVIPLPFVILFFSFVNVIISPLGFGL